MLRPSSTAALATGLAALMLSSGALAMGEGRRFYLARGSGTVAARANTPPPSAHLVSPRRIPLGLSRGIGRARLSADLTAALDLSARNNPSVKSCLIVGDGTDVLFDKQAVQRLAPASNIKLVTAMAVLARLGAESTLKTEVRATVAPVEGIVNGDLYLVGGGDTSLATSEFVNSLNRRPKAFTAMESVADRVQAAGIRQINGAIVGDDHRYDAERSNPSWPSNYVREGAIGPIGALVVNRGIDQANGRRSLTSTPALHAAGVLNELLRQRQVIVTGVPREGIAPPGAPLVVEVESPAIKYLVEEMVRKSDNLAAETLVKELGYKSGAGGTTTAGLTSINSFLKSLNINLGEVTLKDGSGLARESRISCNGVMAVLIAAGPAGHLANGLPVAGRSGTLAGRFRNTAASGRLRAKTGSLRGVAALSGWMDNPKGPPLAFSLLMNELPSSAAGVQLEDKVALALAAYPDAPPLATLAPPDNALPARSAKTASGN